jgi:hypothetical protein
MGSTQPVRRSNRPAGLRHTRRPTSRSSRAAPRGLSLPFGAHHRDPAPSRRLPGTSDDASSHGLSSPYDTSRTGGPVLDGGSLRRRVPRTGFGYPLRDIHHRPSRRLRVGASMGFTLQGLLLERDRYPSRGPCPPDVTRCSRPPRGEAGAAGRLQGLVLATSSCCRRHPKMPAVDPFLGFILPEHAPVRPDARFRRGVSPLALRRLDVQARLGPRVLRCKRVGRSVSGPPALLGFVTFRRSRCSVRRLSGRAHGFASRGDPAKAGGPRSKPLESDATADPGPAARHRRHSVHGR